MLERRGHSLELDRHTGSVLVGASAAFDGPLGEVRGGAEVGRRDQQLEPDEPAGLDRIHRRTLLRIEDQGLGNEDLSQRDLVAFRGGENGGVPEWRALDAYGVSRDQ